MQFNQIIKLLREEKGLTAREIAPEIGVSTSAYLNYERGERQPNFETLCKLADFYGVSTDYLLGRTEVKETAAVDPYTAIGIPKSAAELADRFNENFPKLPKEWQGFFCEVMRQTIEINKKAEECEVESVPEILPDIG